MSDECMGCNEGMENVYKWQEECLKKYGWYFHSVPESGNIINHHTHGLVTRFCMPDLLIRFNIDQQTAQEIFQSVIDQREDVKHGWHGIKLSDVIMNYKVKLVNAKDENDITNLQIILPDEKGRLDFEDIDHKFRSQYF